MSNNKQKLELTWIGKNTRPKLEPRILLEDAEKSHHAKERVSEDDIFDNMLIHGDNLLALRALEQSYTGLIKCVYIDPPYNTGQAFLEYDDGIEHSLWLSLIRERLQIIKNLLHDTGTLFVQLNDEEMAYCKVLLDEIFGRENFINQISIKTKNTAGASGGGEDKRLKKNVEFILIYAKNYYAFEGFNEVYDEEDLFELIQEMEDTGKSWKHTSVLVDRGTPVETRTILDGSGQPIKVTKYKGVKRTTVKKLSQGKESQEQVYIDNFDSIFSDTNAQTSIRTRIMDEFIALEEDELLVSSYVPKSGKDKGQMVEHFYISPTIRRVIWLKDSAVKTKNRVVKLEKTGTHWEGFNWNNVNKEGGVVFTGGKKPEALVKKVLELATNPGDLVLDSFGGSGTTGATAHKMKRRWIMVELKDHCDTMILPRLKSVVDGTDQNGITKDVNWKGGGGFRYYQLAPSMLQQDKWGNWVINKQYNADMLGAAMCKLMGFKYAPSEEHYWIHGHSTENDFIFVTTQTLDHAQLAAISEEVGEKNSLLICCAAFRARPDEFLNLTLKKIPQTVLNRCEWGKDDYSLNILNLPEQAQAEPEPERKSSKNKTVAAMPLFQEPEVSNG